jgi:hypothetical protein
MHSVKKIGARKNQSVLRLGSSWKTGVLLPLGPRNFSLHFCVQTDSGSRLTSCLMETGDSLYWTKATRKGSRPRISAYSRDNNVWIYICLPRHTFMVWCVIQHKDLTVTAPQGHSNCRFTSQDKRSGLCGYHDIQTIINSINNYVIINVFHKIYFFAKRCYSGG